MKNKFALLVCLVTALSCAKENKLKGENRVRTGAKVTSDASPTLNPDGTPSDNGGTNGEGGANGEGGPGAPGAGTEGNVGNGPGTNGAGPNGTPGANGAKSDNVATLVNCPFNSILNFGVFFHQGIFNSERSLQFPADATQIDAAITWISVNDNSPVVLVNGQNANIPLELPDYKAHILLYKINISKSLKAGPNKLNGAAINAFGDEGGLHIAITGSYKAPKVCTTPIVQ